MKGSTRAVRGGLFYQMQDRLLLPVAGAIGPYVSPSVLLRTSKNASISSGRPAKFCGAAAKQSRLCGLAVKNFNRAGMASQ
jgi:hypothetical protein